MKTKAKVQKLPTLHIGADVVRKIRQHARSNSKTEVCGVLVGTESDGTTSVEAYIAGANAAQAGTHVTFTHDTWEHIYNNKDRDYPDERIVGWYHSHPGFGVFLSDHDIFIHKNFFSSPQQVAWVYDPHSDEEGCFGWHGEQIERLNHFSVVDKAKNTVGGPCGGPEPNPAIESAGKDWVEDIPRSEPREKDEDLSRLARIVFAIFSYLAVFLLGGLLVWYFLPYKLVIPVQVDSKTGQELPSFQDPSLNTPGSPGAQQDQPSRNNSQRGNDHQQR